MMRTRYYTPFVFALLLVFGITPALAQTIENFEDRTAGDQTYNDTSSQTSWNLTTGTTSAVEINVPRCEGTDGVINDQCYRVDFGEVVQVSFPNSEANSITMHWHHASGTQPGQARSFSNVNCTGLLAQVNSNVSGAGMVALGGANVRCIRFTNNDGANSNWVDDLTFTATVLTVELANFEARVDDGAVTLAWQTTSENQNLGFEVQQQVAQSSEFEALGFVDGHGTTSQAQAYTYRLNDLAPGTHTFRLKQVDLDGSFRYSATVATTIEVPGAYYLSAAYPNPFNPQTQFELTVKQQQDVRVSVYDLLGREVARLHQGVLPANELQVFRFGADNLPSGIYLIRVVGENFATTRQATLLK